MSRQAGDVGDDKFPPEYQHDEEPVPLGTTSAIPVVFQTYTTTNLPSGTYEVAPLVILSGTNASTQLESNLTIDAVVQGGPLLETGIAGGTYIFGSPLVQSLAGVIVVETTVSKPAGVGTTTAVFGQITVKQVAP